MLHSSEEIKNNKQLLDRLIPLDSVGSLIDPESGITYAQLYGGGCDLESEVFIDDCCDEWFDSLDSNDKKIVFDIIGLV